MLPGPPNHVNLHQEKALQHYTILNPRDHSKILIRTEARCFPRKTKALSWRGKLSSHVAVSADENPQKFNDRGDGENSLHLFDTQLKRVRFFILMNERMTWANSFGRLLNLSITLSVQAPTPSPSKLAVPINVCLCSIKPTLQLLDFATKFGFSVYTTMQWEIDTKTPINLGTLHIQPNRRKVVVYTLYRHNSCTQKNWILL